MKLSRRGFLAAGLGLFAAGCTQNVQRLSLRPGPAWPQRYAPPGPVAGVVPPPITPRPAAGSGGAHGQGAWLNAISRDTWAKAPPIMSRIQPMNGVNKITVHHEGWTPVWFTDVADTEKRLESIRRYHLQHMHAGDIGYHFVIDRAGRLWQGRNLAYQGAHVKDHNEHNVGVMNLGNFDLQKPTSAQLGTLRDTVSRLMNHFHVPVHYLYTHQELMPTRCPGKALQADMVQYRSGGYFG